MVFSSFILSCSIRKEDAFCNVNREKAVGPHMAVTDKELFGKYILRLYFMSAISKFGHSRPEMQNTGTGRGSPILPIFGLLSC